MRLVRIGVAAVSVKVGDFAGNAGRLRAIVEAAKAQGVHLLVTPELCLSGYSLEDRIWWPDIARRSWQSLQELATHCKGLSVFVGLPVRLDAMMYNAAALIHDGSVRGLILKKYLPTYSIFYEGRNWAAWNHGATEINGVPAGELVFDLPFGKVSAEICEDLWSTNSPARARVRAGAEIICNPSASPFTPLKNEQRRRLILGASGSLACVYAYANLLGCDNSRLVFDGGGFIASPEGIVTEAPILSMDYWTLATGVVNLDDVSRVRSENTTWRQDASRAHEAPGIAAIDARGGTFNPASVKDYATQLPRSFYVPGEARTVNESSRYLDELYGALVLGLRDYFEKVGAFDRFLVALSGGRDSALCLLLAVQAAKAFNQGRDAARFAERVASVYLPNKAFSSKATEEAARALADELGVPFKVVSIAEEADLALKKAGELAGGAEQVTALAKQNLQARVRGNMMLNWANSAKGLLLVTSNLSEAAVGYTTTGGDNQGGYSPIANVPKTLVTLLLEHVARRDGIRSLQGILDIPPSAELAPDQRDEADLMPYVVLDDLLYLFARRRMSLPDCWRVLLHRHPQHDAEQLRIWTRNFGRLFAYNQWKREQLPVTLKVLDLDLDPKTGFRFPVTQSIEDELNELSKARP
ncbi:MAG: NAD(+) synthase [Candidatus Hydrogenedentes bacterium]|nr:NAD(+) synthase [Candidatus Hydrogenedentota bacterium]